MGRALLEVVLCELEIGGGSAVYCLCCGCVKIIFYMGV